MPYDFCKLNLFNSNWFVNSFKFDILRFVINVYDLLDLHSILINQYSIFCNLINSTNMDNQIEGTVLERQVEGP